MKEISFLLLWWILFVYVYIFVSSYAKVKIENKFCGTSVTRAACGSHQLVCIAPSLCPLADDAITGFITQHLAPKT